VLTNSTLTRFWCIELSVPVLSFLCLLSITGPNFRGGMGKDTDMCAVYNFLTFRLIV
jgi:hypothetical protein